MKNETKWADVAHMYLISPICLQDDDGNELDMSIAERRGMHYRCRPILRHLDDMSEGEAREIYRLVWGFDIDISVSAWDSGLDWFESLDGRYSSYIFHWLVSRGFDVFGLIESGQAIRKEAGNG